jgi:hypothetical protein
MPVQIPRLADILGADPGQATADQVMTLVASGLPEDTDLDYQQASTWADDDEAAAEDGATELARAVSGLANSRGGLLIIGIQEDARTCAAAATPVPVDGATTSRMREILRSRVMPWIDGVDIRAVSLPDAPGLGFYLITVPHSPLAPHAVRTPGPARHQYAYAHPAVPHTRWLEEAEIADAYRSRFRLAQDQAVRGARLFTDNPTPAQASVAADAVWAELAIVPVVPGGRRLDAAFVDDVRAFLDRQRAASPAPGLALSQEPAVARRRLQFDNGMTFLDLHTDGTAFIRAHVAWRGHSMTIPVPMYGVFLEYQLLGALHLAVAYARWAGGYGDADVLARTNGLADVYLEGSMHKGTTGLETATRTSTDPAHVTVPLDAVADDPRRFHLVARGLAADLLADYGQAGTRLLRPDGTVDHGLLDPAAGAQLKNWLTRSGLDA